MNPINAKRYLTIAIVLAVVALGSLAIGLAVTGGFQNGGGMDKIGKSELDLAEVERLLDRVDVLREEISSEEAETGEDVPADDPRVEEIDRLLEEVSDLRDEIASLSGAASEGGLSDEASDSGDDGSADAVVTGSSLMDGPVTDPSADASSSLSISPDLPDSGLEVFDPDAYADDPVWYGTEPGPYYDPVADGGYAEDEYADDPALYGDLVLPVVSTPVLTPVETSPAADETDTSSDLGSILLPSPLSPPAKKF
ncbi:MAG: hypothetical protein ABIJ46_00160 [bacterium]